MLISQLYIPGVEGLQHILIEKGKIKSVGTDTVLKDGPVIRFENAMAFPGLINSHDHLEFNSFPRLGNHIYKNYTEWGDDIHVRNEDVIKVVQQIPAPLRVAWGLVKNLLNGVTTVVDHGKRREFKNPVISVFNKCHSLHSLHYEKNWKRKLNLPFAKKWPYVVHIGEGTDPGSCREIDQLLKFNHFKRPVVAVHGVAMNALQAPSFKALVWCPASNYFLLDSTTDIASLKHKTSILFGTDSTLSSGWNAWEHIRRARLNGGLTDEELFDALNITAATVWQMYDRGSISEGKTADIVVAKTRGHGFEAFYAIDPPDILLVMTRGVIRLFDHRLLEQLKNIELSGYSRIRVGTEYKFINSNIAVLAAEIRKYYPGISFPVEIIS